MIKAVVFDLDGTLLNTIEDLTISVNFALNQNGFPARTIEEVLSFIGNGVRLLIKRALPPATSERIINKCLEDFRAYYDIHKSDNTLPYPGVVELIKKLYFEGYKMAVVSNKYQRAVYELCAVFYEYMDVFLGEGPDVPKKPDPTGVLKAIKMLSIELDEVIYVGDSILDFEVSINAQIKHCLVSWGFNSRAKLEKLQNAIIADDCEQLYQIIKKP